MYFTLKRLSTQALNNVLEVPRMTSSQQIILDIYQRAFAANVCDSLVL